MPRTHALRTLARWTAPVVIGATMLTGCAQPAAQDGGSSCTDRTR